MGSRCLIDQQAGNQSPPADSAGIREPSADSAGICELPAQTTVSYNLKRKVETPV